MSLLRSLLLVGIGVVLALSFPVTSHRKHETPRCPDQVTVRSGPIRVAKYIRCVARVVPGFDVPKAIEVGGCESGLNPRASNGGKYLGVYQHDAERWPDRARMFGYPGHSAFDPVANIWVTARMVQYDGWTPTWSCA